MTHRYSSLRTDIVRSIGSGHFSSAVLWGTFVGCLATIVEYNLSIVFSDTYSVRYGILVGGIIAGFLCANSRLTSMKAGGYAGIITVTVLSPLAYLFFMAEFLPSIQIDGGVLIWATGSVILLFPITIVIGLLIGAVGGFIGSLVAVAVSHIPWPL